jgi:hypothetical protein
MLIPPPLEEEEQFWKYEFSTVVPEPVISRQPPPSLEFKDADSIAVLESMFSSRRYVETPYRYLLEFDV